MIRRRWLVLGVWVAVVVASLAAAASLGDLLTNRFTLPGTDGKPHTLSAYKGRAVVLAWFPAAFTAG